MGLIKRTIRKKVKTPAKRVIRRKVKTPLKRAARKQVRKVSVKCGTCGKRYTNPLTHVCTVRTDFRRRKAAAERAAKRDAARKRRKAAADRRKAAAAERRKAPRARQAPAGKRKPPSQQHEYQTCRDGDCRRLACAAFTEGFMLGDEEGYRRGEDHGYRRGWPDGQAACPRAHK